MSHTDSYYIYECVNRRDSRMNVSCHKYKRVFALLEWVISHITHGYVSCPIRMSHTTHMNESCVMSHMWVCHVTKVSESLPFLHESYHIPHMGMSHVPYEWVISHIWMSHASRKCVMSQIKKKYKRVSAILTWAISHMTSEYVSCPIWMNRIKHMNESCVVSHIWMCHVTNIHESYYSRMNHITYMNEPCHVCTQAVWGGYD